MCLCSKKASLSDRSELYSPSTQLSTPRSLRYSSKTPTFACDKRHMLRTVGEKTLAEKMTMTMYDERQKKDKVSQGSADS